MPPPPPPPQEEAGRLVILLSCKDLSFLFSVAGAADSSEAEAPEPAEGDG